MKMYFSRNIDTLQKAETELTTTSLQEAIEKTRRALDIAYAGFDNAVEFDLIDSYIYEMNALQKRYKHLTELAALENACAQENSREHSPIRSLISHVFG